jgi:hypothetical protein
MVSISLFGCVISLSKANILSVIEQQDQFNGRKNPISRNLNSATSFLIFMADLGDLSSGFGCCNLMYGMCDVVFFVNAVHSYSYQTLYG